MTRHVPIPKLLGFGFGVLWFGVLISFGFGFGIWVLDVLLVLT